MQSSVNRLRTLLTPIAMFAIALLVAPGCNNQPEPVADNNSNPVSKTEDSNQNSKASSNQNTSPDSKLKTDQQPVDSKLPEADGKKSTPAISLNPLSTEKSDAEQDKDSQGQSSERDDADEDPDSGLAGIPLPTEDENVDDGEYQEVHTIDFPKTWTRIHESQEIWIDLKNKSVIAGGVISLRRGGLEMFICPLRTKEHESVIAVNALSSEIHRALLVLGTNPGRPVQWHPEYRAAHGPRIQIEVLWEENGKIIKRNGRDMVRDFKSKKPLQTDWVFGGSQIFTDPDDGTKIYYGDGGELACLSNFSTATMDLPIQSTNSNDDLLYEAFTENIPSPGTKVYVIFAPQADAADQPPRPRKLPAEKSAN